MASLSEEEGGSSYCCHRNVFSCFPYLPWLMGTTKILRKKNLEGLISKTAKAALDFFFNFLLVSNLLCVKIHKHPISADVA